MMTSAATTATIYKSQRRNNKLFPLLIIVYTLSCVTYHCQSLILLPLLQSNDRDPRPTIIKQQHRPGDVNGIQRPSDHYIHSSSARSIIQDGTLLLSAMEQNYIRNTAVIPVQTQSQQMNDAMVITTMRGTVWRVVEERYLSNPKASFGKNSPPICKSLATFSGFASDANKGTVSVEYMCNNRGSSKTDVTAVINTDTDTDTDPFIANIPTISSIPLSPIIESIPDIPIIPPSPPNIPNKPSNGRWVSKPSRISRGSIQTSARWKVKIPKGGEGGGTTTVIYKGFIEADKMIGRSNKSISAEMVGVLLTGEEVNKEQKIGTFTADLVRQLSEDEVDVIKISGGAIYIAPPTTTTTNTNDEASNTNSSPIITLTPK